MSPSFPTKPLEVAALALLAALVFTQSFIDLELGVWLAGDLRNAPVTDLAALGLLALALPRAATWAGWRSWPGLSGYAAFLAVALLSAATSFEAEASVHAWWRRLVFPYVAYGIGVATWSARPALRPWVERLILVGLGATAALSLVTSVGRVLAGDALWFAPLLGLTPNHKTLAVSLAGALPLVLQQRDGRRGVDAVLVLILAAIGLSLSKTSWITTALALALFFPRGRPLARRPLRTAPAVVLALAAAVYAPVLLNSKAMLDAARSRHSLNKRAVAMVAERPLLGIGPGTNVLVEQVTFPDYRVNGVDAHGVVQKVASETGLLGLGAYGAFFVGTGALLVRRWRSAGGRYEGAAWGAVATYATLHSNLLLSTESFSSTHWAPLALALGLSASPSEESS